jgi:very-short-patch-repair endonuclease
MRKPLTALARDLRRDATDAEARLWSELRGRRLCAVKFRRQRGISRAISDFVCEEARLVVELDGGQHAESEADTVRTEGLNAAGYLVLRFWNHDVLQNLDGVLHEIASTLAIARGKEEPFS